MLTEDEKHYIGGIIDGDGCISSSIHKNNGSYINSCVVTSSTDYEYINIINDIIINNGYKCYINSPKIRSNIHKKLFTLKLSQNVKNISKFLNEIKRYVVLKRPRVELLLNIVNGIDKFSNLHKLKILNFRGITENIEPIIPSSKKYIKPYLAGLLDSEGTIMIVKDNKSPWLCFKTRVHLLQSTSYELINYVGNMIPYDYIIKTSNNNRFNNRKPLYCLTIRVKHQLDLLNDLDPFLILKKSHSKILSNFRTTKENREELFITLKELNQRGNYTYTVPAKSCVRNST